ncbi:MAG: thioredoxin [Sutterella sp.]|nr:thioredoxin [Sutterella sp.]
MSELVHVTDANFDEVVLKSNVPVVVDFWAPWCGPCRMLAPKLDQAAQTFAGKVQIVKYNCDESSAVAVELGIQSIPTMIIYKNGQAVARRTGSCDQATLDAFISSVLAD